MKPSASTTLLCASMPAERIDAAEAQAEEHGVMPAAQRREIDVDAEPPARHDRDAADAEDEVDLGLGEIGRRLVGGDAVFVEAAELRPGVVERHGMAEQRQAMRRRQPRRPGPHHGDAAAGRREPG